MVIVLDGWVAASRRVNVALQVQGSRGHGAQQGGVHGVHALKL
jgi:hypothetical protein